ncbi:mitochondrial ribosomal protein S7 [Rhynchophorus ferrugineus]|uniref:mitochondrial ribosomal protein S7 n=1 Tax=Rhynchophorus ferrugineus TaxID=354439 RepID=UPI003FCCCA65
MAALKTISTTKHLIFKPKIHLFSPFIQLNGMSQYPHYYIEPIYRKEDQKELEKKGEISKYAHLPTKAAFSDHTCSSKHDPLVSLFTNYVMKSGKKSLARDLLEKTFEKVKRIQLERFHKTKNEEDKNNIELNPKVIFYKAVENSKPLLQLTGIKRGGVKYQVPVPITDKRSQFISMKWLIEAAKEKDRTVKFADQLAKELIDAANNSGRVIKKKQDLHKQCEANRAYAHYRWS